MKKFKILTAIILSASIASSPVLIYAETDPDNKEDVSNLGMDTSDFGETEQPKASGKNWYISQDGVLNIIAGEWEGYRPWQMYESEIREIRVVPTEDCDKVILPPNSSGMFAMLYNLTSFDASDFDTSHVTDMSYMFSHCEKIEDLDLSDFDTSNVTNMEGMFNACENLKNLNVSSFDTSHVTNFSSMFYACYSLPSLDLSSFKTDQAITMTWMFCMNHKLESLNLSNFNTSNVTAMAEMYYRCDSLEKINLSAEYFNSPVAAKNCPQTEDAKWYPEKDPERRESWKEMAESWSSEQAGWWNLSKECFIKFETNHGSDIPELKAVYGEPVDISSYIPVRAGYDFTGWYSNPDLTDSVINIPFGHDMTLYAGWKIQSRTLSFECNGGLTLSPVTVNYGTDLELKKYVTVRDGYTFTGWYLDPDCKNKADETITLNENMTLYAGWQPKNGTENSDKKQDNSDNKSSGNNKDTTNKSQNSNSVNTATQTGITPLIMMIVIASGMAVILKRSIKREDN